MKQKSPFEQSELPMAADGGDTPESARRAMEIIMRVMAREMLAKPGNPAEPAGAKEPA